MHTMAKVTGEKTAKFKQFSYGDEVIVTLRGFIDEQSPDSVSLMVAEVTLGRANATMAEAARSAIRERISGDTVPSPM